jgi:large repetitive protein
LDGTPAASVAITNVVPVSCFGLSNGSMQASVFNGTAPFQYQWSVPNAAGPVINNMPSGLYTVTVTDANGCSDSAPALINSPNPLILSTQSQPADCGGANGSASVSANGGTSPYTYQWSSAGGANPNVTNLPAGLYFVTVTDQQLCTATTVAQVGSISTLQATITGSSPVRCAGGNDGAATVAVTGGTGPFSYTWFPEGGNAATASGLSAGTYSVQVLDINQCIASALVTINEAPPTLHSINTIPANCNATDGSAAISSSGGTGAFSYQWPAGIAPQALASGIYAVTITDQNQCKDTILVTVPALPPVELTLVGTKDPSCNGGSDGEIQFVVSGGVAPFQYIFSGTGASSATLAAGMHTIIVFDKNGCRDTITATLNDPPPISFEVDVQSIACFGTNNGVLEVNNLQNGLPPYQYALNQGAFGADNQFDQLAAGTYEVAVMDAAGCTISDTVLVQSAPQNSIDAGPDQAVPLGSQVTLAAQASVPFLISSYQWQPALPGGCTNCPETSFTPEQSGTYTVVATDQNGCVWTDALQIRVLPGQVFVPNIFNPDAPAPNNRFWLNEGGGVDQVEYLRIYDRWGSLVFETEQRTPDAQGSGWNGLVRGQDAPSAVYTWVMRLRWLNGQAETLQGDVTLIR